MIQYAGQNLLQTTPALDAWLSANLSCRDVFMSSVTQYAGYPLQGLPLAWDILDRKCRLNTLYWPRGASRWTWGLFLVNQSILNAIYSSASYRATFPGTSGLPASLSMADGNGGSMSTPLWTLPPYPLNNGLFILPLVDDRFFWQATNTGPLATNSPSVPWLTLINELIYLLGEQFNMPSSPVVSSVYMSAAGDLLPNNANLPQFVDYVATSIGCRLVRNLDGTFQFQNAADGLTAQQTTAAYNFTKRAGGPVVVDLVPNQIQVIVPNGAAQSPISIASLSLLSSSVQSTYVGTKTLGSLPVANVSGVFSSNVTALCVQLATDWYNFATFKEDVVYDGINSWQGITNSLDMMIEWTSRYDDVSTRIWSCGLDTEIPILSLNPPTTASVPPGLITNVPVLNTAGPPSYTPATNTYPMIYDPTDIGYWTWNGTAWSLLSNAGGGTGLPVQTGHTDQLLITTGTVAEWSGTGLTYNPSTTILDAENINIGSLDTPTLNPLDAGTPYTILLNSGTELVTNNAVQFINDTNSITHVINAYRLEVNANIPGNNNVRMRTVNTANDGSSGFVACNDADVEVFMGVNGSAWTGTFLSTGINNANLMVISSQSAEPLLIGSEDASSVYLMTNGTLAVTLNDTQQLTFNQYGTGIPYLVSGAMNIDSGWTYTPGTSTSNYIVSLTETAGSHAAVLYRAQNLSPNGQAVLNLTNDAYNSITFAMLGTTFGSSYFGLSGNNIARIQASGTSGMVWGTADLAPFVFGTDNTAAISIATNQLITFDAYGTGLSYLTSGAMSTLTLGTGLAISGSTLNATTTGTVSSITAGTGLSGGTITTTGTISLAAIAASSLLANSSGSSAVPSAVTLGTNLSFSGSVLNASTGGMSIGGTVTGGTVTCIPWIGSGPVLAQDSGFTFTQGSGSSNYILGIVESTSTAVVNKVQNTNSAGITSHNVTNDVSSAITTNIYGSTASGGSFFGQSRANTARIASSAGSGTTTLVIGTSDGNTLVLGTNNTAAIVVNATTQAITLPAYVTAGLFYTASGGVVTTLGVGSGLSISGGNLINTSSGGTVTNVTFTGDGTVLSNTPSTAVTTTGTLTATLNSQSANKVFAGPTTGSAATPTFRSLVAADVSGLTGTGTVTSVTFTGDGTIFTATASSAVTTSGTLTPVGLVSHAQNTFLGTPNGAAGPPAFRSLVTADLPSGTGTVTSITFTGDGTVLSSTPSTAVTSTGTVAATLNTQSANKFLAGPSTGSAASPTFRSIVAADIAGLTGTGTVTSVSFTGDGTVFSSTPTTAVTVSGTLTPTLNSQTPNLVFASPASGGAGVPTFRTLVAADLPSGSGTGTVTSVTPGSGLASSPNPITATGTISIATSGVTYAMIQNVSPDVLLGNPTGSAAPPAEIPLGAGMAFVAGALACTGGGTITYTTINATTINATTINNNTFVGGIGTFNGSVTFLNSAVLVNGSGDGEVTLFAPLGTYSYGFGFPDGTGTANQALITDGTGQTSWANVVLSVAAGDSSLTISPTSGNVSAILNTGHTNTFTIAQNVAIGINSTSTDGIWITCARGTPATSSQAQWSPRLRFSSFLWTGSTSQESDFIIENKATTSNSAALVVSGQLGTGGYSPFLQISQTGLLRLNSYTTAGILTNDTSGNITSTAIGSIAVSSISNSDGTLTISPTYGTVVASLALGHPNNWTAQQTFTNTTLPVQIGYDANNYVTVSTNSSGSTTIQATSNQVASGYAPALYINAPNAASGNTNGGNLFLSGGEPSGSGDAGIVYVPKAALNLPYSLNNDVLVGNGLPGIVGGVNLQNQTGSISKTLLYTTIILTPGIYEYVWSVVQTTSGAHGTLAVTIYYTQDIGSEVNQSNTLTFTGTGILTQSGVFQATAASNISYAVTLTETLGAATYNFYLALKRLW